MKAAVSAHFKDKLKEYFLKGIEVSLKHCINCIDIKGNCIEKLNIR